MTDLTVGTDLFFTKGTLTSLHLLLFCVCTLGLYPELVSLQKTPMNMGTSPLPSAAFIPLFLLKAALPSPEGHRGTKPLRPLLALARGTRHAVPLAPSLPGVCAPQVLLLYLLPP